MVMPLRRIFKLLAILICIGFILFGIYFFYLYFQEKPEKSASLPALPVTTNEARILVIAPHCDDETLGCGGIIRNVLEAGGQVMVVVMTNGDGFTFGAEEQFHRLFLTNADYIQSGYDRQFEFLRAVQRLGISESQVVFLGYPDRGLRAIWADHWDNSQPYQSRYTGRDYSPYNNSYRPNAPYAGEAVLADIEQIIREFKPTVIFSPHPADEHPDHAATWAFMAAVATKVNNSGVLPNPKLYTYLIHRGDFPIPHGYRPKASLLPPRPLYQNPSQQWQIYSLTPDQLITKEQALNEYVSQLRVPIMSDLLHSFIRTNELFEEVIIPTASSKPMDIDLTELNAWSNQEPVLVQERGISVLGALERKAKIATIASTIQDKSLWLHFHIPDFSRKLNQYQVSMVDFRFQLNTFQREKRTFNFSMTDTDVYQNNIIRYQDDVIIKIPYSESDLPDYFLIQVLTKDRFGKTIDHTVWQPVLVNG